MNETFNNPFIRVRTIFYKIVKTPLLSGDFIDTIVQWNLDTIKQDYEKQWRQILKTIPKYDGFCNIPSHINYQRSYSGFYNQYEPLKHVPKEGKFDTIQLLLEHIFEEHINFGLDYLTILFQKPIEPLPILCLISKERGTGKSTFLALLKEIFSSNMTYNSNEDFRSNFNDSWINKLIIAVDEVLLNRKEDSEKLKNLSTSNKYKVEAKFGNRSETEIFGKFILCSNNEENFIHIDPLETRYWIRKINPLKQSDPFILKKMISEIPAFMYFLATREISYKKTDRMWFNSEDLITEHLLKIKGLFRNRYEVELLDIISEIMESHNLDTFSFTNKDAIELLKNNNIRLNRGEIKRLIDNWKIKISDNTFNYTTYKYDSTGLIYETQLKGRFYTLERSDIKNILML